MRFLDFASPDLGLRALRAVADVDGRFDRREIDLLRALGRLRGMEFDASMRLASCGRPSSAISPMRAVVAALGTDGAAPGIHVGVATSEGRASADAMWDAAERAVQEAKREHAPVISAH